MSKSLFGFHITDEGHAFLRDCTSPVVEDGEEITCPCCGDSFTPYLIFNETIEPTDENMEFYLLALLEDVRLEPETEGIADESRFWIKFDPPAPPDGITKSLDSLRAKGLVLHEFAVN